MDTIFATGTVLNCGCARTPLHPVWTVFAGDRRVNVFPKDQKLQPLHNCVKLSVAQEKGGVKRLYIIKDESIISKGLVNNV
jgi:hypothetical protein